MLHQARALSGELSANFPRELYGRNSLIQTAFSAPAGARTAAETGNPRIQTRSPRPTATGHIFFVAPVAWRSLSKSFTFFSCFVCAGQYRSPGCQLRTRTAPDKH
jgi:hypothetical protein